MVNPCPYRLHQVARFASLGTALFANGIVTDFTVFKHRLHDDLTTPTTDKVLGFTTTRVLGNILTGHSTFSLSAILTQLTWYYNNKHCLRQVAEGKSIPKKSCLLYSRQPRVNSMGVINPHRWHRPGTLRHRRHNWYICRHQ